MRIFISGVSSGLGYGLAKVYLAMGDEVYGCSRRKPKDLVGQGLHFAAIDLADSGVGPSKFCKLINGKLHFDLAILNAGKLGQIRDMREASLEDLRETMEINVWSNKWLLDCLFDDERSVEQVVAISSGASQSGSRGWNGYSLSKSALNLSLIHI